MCEFCDARLYCCGSDVKWKTYSYVTRLRMKHAGRGKWKLHVLAEDGEIIACFPVYHCPMCGRKLAEKGDSNGIFQQG